jgi:hypothetical protein
MSSLVSKNSARRFTWLLAGTQQCCAPTRILLGPRLPGLGAAVLRRRSAPNVSARLELGFVGVEGEAYVIFG